MTNIIEQLAQEGHGCVQIEAANEDAPLVVLGGPIKRWWADELWDSEEHRTYVQWRDAVRVALVQAGYCVYSPHRAWQGAWSESAQLVNDAAVRASHAFIALCSHDELHSGTAEGTRSEAQVAGESSTPIVYAPVGGPRELTRLLRTLNAVVGVASLVKGATA